MISRQGVKKCFFISWSIQIILYLLYFNMKNKGEYASRIVLCEIFVIAIVLSACHNQWRDNIPANKKQKHNICTMLDQRRRRWADVVQILYKCFVFAWMTVNSYDLLKIWSRPTLENLSLNVQFQISCCYVLQQIVKGTPWDKTFSILPILKI